MATPTIRPECTVNAMGFDESNSMRYLAGLIPMAPNIRNAAPAMARPRPAPDRTKRQYRRALTDVLTSAKVIHMGTMGLRLAAAPRVRK